MATNKIDGQDIFDIKSIEASMQELERMMAELDKSLKKRMKSLQEDAAGLGTALSGKELSEALKEVAAALKTVSGAQKTTKETTQGTSQAVYTLTRQYREEKKVLDALAVTIDKNSETYKEQQDRVGKLENQVKQFRDEIKRTSNEVKNGANAYDALNSQLAKTKKELKELSKVDGNKLTFTDPKKAKQLQKAIQEMDKSLKGFDKSIGQSQRNVGNYSSAIGGVGTKLLGMATSFTVALFAIDSFSQAIRGAFDEFVQLDKMLRLTSATAGGDFKANLTVLNDLTREIGKTSSSTASEVADLTLQLSRLGFTTQEIVESAPSINKLAIAFGEGLGQTAETVAKILNAYNLEAEQTEKVTNNLTKAFSSSSLNLEKFGTAFSLVGGVANQAGIDLVRLSALLGNLTDAGLEASTAGTSLRTTIIRLNQKFGQVQGLDDFQDKMKRLVKESGGVANAIDRTAQSAVAILLQNEKLIQSTVRSYTRAAEELERINAEIERSTSNMLATNTSSWQELFNTIGSGVHEEFNDFIKSLTDLARNLSNNESFIQSLTSLTRGFIKEATRAVEFVDGFSESLDELLQKLGVVEVVAPLESYKKGVEAADEVTEDLVKQVDAIRDAFTEAEADSPEFKAARKAAEDLLEPIEDQIKVFAERRDELEKTREVQKSLIGTQEALGTSFQEASDFQYKFGGLKELAKADQAFFATEEAFKGLESTVDFSTRNINEDIVKLEDLLKVLQKQLLTIDKPVGDGAGKGQSKRVFALVTDLKIEIEERKQFIKSIEALNSDHRERTQEEQEQAARDIRQAGEDIINLEAQVAQRQLQAKITNLENKATLNKEELRKLDDFRLQYTLIEEKRLNRLFVLNVDHEDRMDALRDEAFERQKRALGHRTTTLQTANQKELDQKEFQLRKKLMFEELFQRKIEEAKSAANIKNAQLELDEANKLLSRRNITDDDYLALLEDRNNKEVNLEKAKLDELERLRREAAAAARIAIEGGVDILLQSVDLAESRVQASYDARHEALQNQLDDDLSATKGNDVAQENLRKEAEERAKVLRRQQAEEEKKFALFRAAINAPSAIILGYAQGGPAGAVAATLVTAAQIALIASEPIPSFYTGGTMKKDGLAEVAERGQELIQQKDGLMRLVGSKGNNPDAQYTYLHAGDKVINNSKTQALLPDVSALQREQKVVVNVDQDKVVSAIMNKPERYTVYDSKGMSIFEKRKGRIKKILNKKL